MEMIKDLKHAEHYTSPQGYEIVRKDDRTIRTTSIWLSKTDSIYNYQLEEELTEEELAKLIDKNE